MPVSDPTDPADLTPDQRLDEVADILAAGVQRLLRARAEHAMTDLASAPEDFTEIGLDVSAGTGIHVPTSSARSATESAEGDEA